MKRLPAVLTILLIIVVGLSYYAYDFFTSKEQVTPKDIVPDQAVLVYEFSDCAECLRIVKSLPVSRIAQQAVSQVEVNDSLARISRYLASPRPGSLVSLHVTSKENIDLLFILPRNVGSNGEELDAEIAIWRKQEKLSYTERVFNEVTIRELSSGKKTFSWVDLEGIWAGSFTPFLVEDVVRTYGLFQNKNHRSILERAASLPTVKNDAGNIYVNTERFMDFLKVFAEGNVDFGNFGEITRLDVRGSETSLVVNGFTVGRPSGGSRLKLFEDQDPVSFNLKDLVSNRTIALVNYGFSNGELFFKNLRSLFPPPNDSSATALKSINVNIESLFPVAAENFSVAYLESGRQGINKIGIIETKDVTPWMTALDKISGAIERNDTLFYETYATYEIRLIDLNKFTNQLFHPFLNDFSQTYYTAIGKAVVFAETLDGLRHYLDDLDNSETWGRSVNLNQFLESTLLESNYSLYVNTPRVWNILASRLTAPWRRFVLAQRPELNKWGPLALQLSHLNDSYYTNLFMQFQQPGDGGRPSVLITNLDKPAVRLFNVRNHTDRSTEFIVQDSANFIHLISSEGKVLWTKQINAPISGDITQIDFYNNGKLQYFFSTRNTMYIIDRLGMNVDPFPVSVPDKTFSFAVPVDYDKSKRYRFLVTDDQGDLFLFDKEGNNLEGWTPRKTDGRLFASATHLRVGARDYMLAIREDGRVYLMNRRGELIRNFPLNIDARPTGDFSIDMGRDERSTRIVVVSRDGFKIRFNLEGEIVNREPLLKNSIEARFMLVSNTSKNAYLVVRQEPALLTIYGEDEKQLLTNNYVGSNPVSVQYFTLNAGKAVIAITDLAQEMTYLYDELGTLLTPVPIESKAISVFAKDIRTTEAVSVFGNTVVRQPVTLY